MKTTLLRNMLATIAALFISMFALPQQVQAQNYDLWIAGTQVTLANCSDLSVIPGVSGTVRYHPATHFLTLENATINATGNNYGISGKIDGLIVLVKGTSSITALQSALTFTKPTTIRGSVTEDGTLNVTSGNISGIYANGTSLTIENCTVNAKSAKYGIAGFNGNNGEDLIIRNATVTAEGSRYGSIRDFKTLTLKGCAITQPAGATFNASLGGVALNGELVKTKVTIEPVPTYDLEIAGTEVNSVNCNDLSVIPGVSGTVKYDHATKTLTLDNATINTSTEEHSGIGICSNYIDGLTIRLVGQSTITAEKSAGILNNNCTLTFTGGGKLTVNGSTTASNEEYRRGIHNSGGITVNGCTLEVSAGISGIVVGRWKFDHCTVRAKGGGSSTDEYKGSIGWMWDKPEFIGCNLTAPAGAYWKEFQDNNGYTYYSLFGADDKVVTDWVTISTDPSGIDTPTADVPTHKRGIYNLLGVKMQGTLDSLPAGVYIVDGRKVVKK